jgi:16S rRNA (cytosine1402-N4)-methyltransferase
MTDASNDALHTPVMLDRCLDLLAPALTSPGAVFVDGTLGLGGHAEAFLRRFPELTLVGIDRDPEALRLAGERLAPFADRTHLVHAVSDALPTVLSDLDTPRSPASSTTSGCRRCNSTASTGASRTRGMPHSI